MKISAIDPRAFRDALGHYASGITIITGMEDGAPVGFTCQSFYSVSLEPPLISFCVARTSESWPKIRPSGRFVVNLLSWDQQPLSNAFARKAVDRWQSVAWSPSEGGNPVIDDALLWLDCTTYAEHEAGDHHIVVGEVRSFGYGAARETKSPLLYFQGSYCQLVASGPR